MPVPAARERTADPSLPTVQRPILYAAVVAAGAAFYRFLSFSGFSNDHFMHLAWAHQMLRGDLPGRDFIEPGMPLTIALSAAAQRLLGVGIFAELVLCIAFLAVAAGITYWLGARLTGSRALGITAAALQIATYPRLYNYPKIFVPVVALALTVKYLDRPGTGRAALIGLWIAIGFLFRHDFIVYLGLPAVALFICTFISAAPRIAVRHALACSTAGLAVLLPYLLILHVLGGIVEHVNDSLEFGRGERVEGINHPAFTLGPVPSQESPEHRISGGVVIDDLRVVGRIVRRENAEVLMYYGAWVLPIALLIALAHVAAKRTPRALGPYEIQVLVLAVLSLTMGSSVLFIRSQIGARLADLGATMPLIIVLIATGGLIRTTFARISGHAVFGIALVAVFIQGRVWNELDDAGFLNRPEAVVLQGEEIWSESRTWPWARFWPEGELPQVIRYLNACTSRDDRILVTWWAPETFMFADRRFAAGHAYFIRRSFLAPKYQEVAVARMKQQHVPVVLINLAERNWFSQRLSRLDAYINDQYTIVGTYRNYDSAEVAVAVRNGLHQSGIFSPTGWPCFTESGSRRL
jgi:hypothetical protein